MKSDNQPALAIAKIPMHHERTKHVQIDQYFTSEKIKDATISLSHVPTKQPSTDILTKALWHYLSKFILQTGSDKHIQPSFIGNVDFLFKEVCTDFMCV